MGVQFKIVNAEDWLKAKENEAFIRGVNAFKDEFTKRIGQYSLPRNYDERFEDWVITNKDILDVVDKVVKSLIE